MVLEVALTRFPVPGADVPLEALLDLRNDDDMRTHLTRFRAWVMRTASEDVDTQLVAAELDEMLADYRNYMRVKRMSIGNTVLRAVLLPIRLMNAGLGMNTAEGLLSIRSRRVQLMEAELSAPGRAVAFLVEAPRRLGSS